MTAEEAIRLFQYHDWANERLFPIVASLSVEQYERPIVSSFPSVRATVAHVVSADWIWLERWRGFSPDARPAWTIDPPFALVDAKRREIEASRRDFLAGIRDEDLPATVAFRLLNGDASTGRLGDLMRHVVNHGTYHRGQLVTMLRQLGASPTSTDLVLFDRAAPGIEN